MRDFMEKEKVHIMWEDELKLVSLDKEQKKKEVKNQ
jgi:hypothetical protein